MNRNKNKKLSAVIACIACLLMLVAVTVSNYISAEDTKSYDLTVQSGYTPEAEVPLTTKVSTNEFFFNGNINPGDILDANILFENTSEEDRIQITISEIKNLLGDDDLALELLDELELTIKADDKIIYKGPHSKTTTPVIGWIEVNPGETIIVNISVYFPKEADNTYQNAPLNVKYVFESRIDIPNEEETTEFTEQIKTGIESEDAPNYSMFILGLGACVIVLYLVTLIIRAILKKKKEDKDKDKTENKKE